jgi:uncharacterized 2Fe-2S/4Fe-4S cluster protein (DUF4445 family)
MDGVTVLFLPHNKEVTVSRGENLLKAAMEAGVHVNASCGGEGVCGKCRVLIQSGEAECAECPRISPEDYRTGYRQACKTTALSDLEVVVPLESRLDKKALARTLEHKPSGKHITSQQLEVLASGAWYNPALKKFFVEVDPPRLDDNISDLSRLLRSLKRKHHIENVSVDFLLLKKLSRILRESSWQVTVTVVRTRMESQLGEYQLRGSRRPKMISVEPGDTTDRHYSIVLDVGTTTLWGQLLDLNERRVLAESSEYNPQVSYGEDVISRIIYSQKPGGLKKLQELVVSGLNRIIDDLAAKSGVELRHVSHLTAAGNTVMTHILVGLDPKYIRESPYTPVANFIPPVRAIRIGLHAEDYVYLYTFPSVASYVGGDIVSGVLGSGIYQKKEMTLYMDVGTNGEIVVGSADWLMTASCSAGPAFEGAGLKHGMRAMEGAIEGFHIDPVTLEPMILTIGMVKPRGICGSGAINIVAELLVAGVIDQNGKFNTDIATPRIRESGEGKEYVLVWKEDSQTGEDIVIAEADIDNLIRAKAAMFAGCSSLLEKVGLTFSELDQVIIAGGFGDYIDVEKAITIGLLPDIAPEKFLFVGNGSLLGAKLISLSNELLDDGERIARKMTNVELSEDHSFMDKYMAALFLPHTEARLFPSVSRILSERARANGEAAQENVH